MPSPGSTTSRGYGHRHQQERRRWEAIVKAGKATCTRCGHPIPPDAPWDLDHSDDRTRYLGVACRSCNRRAGVAKANRNRRIKRALRTTALRW